MLGRIFSIFLLVFTSYSLSSQEWTLLDQNNGLPSSNITDIQLASPNQIWIGSDSGLFYYDNQNFVFFNTQNSNLPSNNVKELAIVIGEVWVNTDSGLSKYDGRRFVNYNTNNGLLSNEINGLAVDTNDHLWIASNQSVSKFDGSTFTHFSGRGAKDIVVEDSSNHVLILKYPVVFNIPNAGLTVVEMYDGQNWTVPNLNPFTEYYKSDFHKSPNGKIFLVPTGSGNQYFAELEYPFNLIKRTVITESTISRTPRYMNEFNGENWMNYWGAASIYRGLAKDSVFNPQYLVPSGSRLNEMAVTNSNIYIATDRGLLIGPSTFEDPKHSQYLDINELKAGMHIKGSVFHNYESEGPSFEFPVDSNTHMINYAVLRLGIKQDSTQSNYEVYPREASSQAFDPGPYHQNNVIVGDEYVMKVNKAEIDLHQQSYNQSGYNIPASIMNWPATADSNLTSFTDMAPFFDANNNGCYEPRQGDYPIIKGDQAIYWINHPKDKTIPLEYHWMLYGYNSTDTALNRSVFLQVKLINRGQNTIEYIKAGFEVDGDVGNPRDDYAGSDSSREMIYFYNGDSFDATTVLRKGYVTNPPALGITALSSSASSGAFMQFKLGNAPYSEDWNFLHGMDADSSYFVNPFTNMQTRYQFNGDPVSTSGWSEVSTRPNMFRSNPTGERSGTLGLPAFSLQSGQSHTVEIAFNVAQGLSRAGIADYIPMLRNQVDRLRAYYATQQSVPSNYSQYFNCPVLVSVEEQFEDVNKEINFYPNPSNGQFYINNEEVIRNVEIRSVSGKLMQVVDELRPGSSIDLSNFQNGYYLARYQSSSGWKQEKLLLIK